MAGRPMLPTNLLNAATGAMRSLHYSVLSLEKRRLSENDVAYPVRESRIRVIRTTELYTSSGL